MLNKFPLWKNLMILLVITFGFVYAAPNFYPADAAVQLSGQSGAMVIDESVLAKVESALNEGGIEYFGSESDGFNYAPKKLFKQRWVVITLLLLIWHQPHRNG